MEGELEVGSTTTISEEIASAVAKAVPDAIAQLANKEKEAQEAAERARMEELGRIERANPSEESIYIIRSQDAMLNDALSKYPDAPASVRQSLQEKLSRFTTRESIDAARRENVHKVIANSEVLEAMNLGAYTPEKYKQAAKVTIEPTASETAPTPLSMEATERSASVSKSLGIEITEDDIRREMAHMENM